MPSKAKKQPKTTPLPSKPNFSDQSPSPYSRTPTTPLQLTYGSEEDVFNALEEASRIFPALLRNSALIGQVTSVASDNSKGCTVWLSEAAMVSSSLVPGSIVSVSLASLHTGVSDSFPLRSLEAECSMNMGINSGDAMANQVGNYFALATVFPSCKVSKKGVCLSLSLSYSMGCPASGSFIFVSFIQNQSLTGTVNGSDKPLNAAVVNQLSLYKCKELYLKLVPATNRSNIKRNVSSSIKYQEDTTDDHSRNQIFSTPKTESYQSRLNSSNSGPLPSARSEDSETMPFNSMKTPFDSVDVHEVLGDESTKKLLQTCANSWLNSRSLLYGNLVTIPILSEVCIFQVIGTNRLLLDDSNRDCTGENGSKISPQALKLVDHVDAFVVDGETKVYFYLPLGSTLQTPNIRSLPVSDIDCENVKEEAEGESLKLGGLSKEYAILKDIIYSSSVKDILSSLGLRSTKGVLLHGPPGTGKTSLARLCAHDAGVKVFSINGPELVSQYYGESEKALHELFDSASQSAPAVVFIDELDAIAPARKDGGEELSQRMVATLLNLMDGISSSDGIIIIAATNRPDCIEPALRRPGRLDREIEIGVPSPEQRRDILHTLISVMKHTLTNDEIKGLAINTHGFVGADLSALCNEAALVCLRRYITQKKLPGTLDPRSMKENGFEAENGVDYPKDDSDSSSSFEFLPSVNQNGISDNIMDIIPDGHGNNIRAPCALGEDHMLKVTIEDFEKARIKVKPSAMREVILEVPKVTWEDVGGQKEVKAQLREAVEWPQKHQDAFKRIGTTPPSGVLLFGPPGCSKTLMARAVASEAGLNFLAVKGPELFSKWVGESEKAVKALFAKARANAPSVIFFDEIDGLAITRGRESDGISVSDRVISQLLVEMDGLQQRVNVTVIAATNRPDKIDPALLRPGRFDRLLYVGPPNESDREDIFRIHLRKIPCSLDVSAKELAALTEGFTGADISLVCREGAVAALEESLIASEVRMKHLKSAIVLVQPSEIPSYKELSAKFQRLVHSSARKEESKCQTLPSQTNPTSRTSWTSFW